MCKLRLQSRLMVELGSPSISLVVALYAHHLRAFQREGAHDAGRMGGDSPYLAASSSSRSFTNCRGTCRESTLSAICSRIRRWLPSVVGKRYMRQMAPPNTDFSKVSFRNEAYLDRTPNASVKLSSTGRTI